MGTGERIKKAEREAYHKGVSVHFNKKTWVDNDFAMKWVQIFKDYPGVKQVTRLKKAIICFFDNLGAQVREDFKRELKKLGVFAHYYPEGCTDLVQVVDGGVGSALKACMERLLSEWLLLVPDPTKPEQTNNWRMTRTKKEGNHVTMSEQRILCSKLLGEAWEELSSTLELSSSETSSRSTMPSRTRTRRRLRSSSKASPSTASRRRTRCGARSQWLLVRRSLYLLYTSLCMES